MRVLFLVLCVVSLSALQADPFQKGKRADIEIVEAKAHRVENKVSLEGKVRVLADKPLSGLVLTFDFLDVRNGVLTTENDEITLDRIPPGETPAFHAETSNPPGSIRFRMRAFDGFEQELRVANPGPYLIE
jgi:hypothetical protein